MKRAILFRFHKNFPVCKNHIDILRYFNPKIPIYGLYGGPGKYLPQTNQLNLDHIFMIPMDDWYWKWQSGDLTTRWWYKDVGHKIDFDMLHIWEWDLILLESIASFMKHVKKGVAITDKQPMSRIYNSWDWVTPVLGRQEWQRLNKRLRKKYKITQKPVAGIFGGACISRQFLKRYVNEDIGSFCNDEVRLALYAQAYNMMIYDTGLKSKMFGFDHDNIEASKVYWHYQRGLKSFHPVREKLNLNKIKQIRGK